MINVTSLNSLRYLVLIILFTASIVIISCRSDTPTSPNSPAGTVLYSRDSVSVWLQPSGSGSGHDSVYFSTSETGGVEVIYTLQSNIDTSYGKANWAIYTNATPPLALIFITGPVDITDSTNLNLSSSGSTYFSFAVRLSVNISPVPYYVRMKNIKIRKL